MEQIKLHKKCDDKILLDYGFRKRKYRNEITYTLSVPLYKYKNSSVIEVQFRVFRAYGCIGYDIVESCSGNLYIHFYDKKYSNSDQNDVLKIVKNNLNKELQTMKNAMIISDMEV